MDPGDLHKALPVKGGEVSMGVPGSLEQDRTAWAP